jgi:hypothetical protein
MEEIGADWESKARAGWPPLGTFAGITPPGPLASGTCREGTPGAHVSNIDGPKTGEAGNGVLGPLFRLESSVGYNFKEPTASSPSLSSLARVLTNSTLQPIVEGRESGVCYSALRKSVLGRSLLLQGDHDTLPYISLGAQINLRNNIFLCSL